MTLELVGALAERFIWVGVGVIGTVFVSTVRKGRAEGEAAARADEEEFASTLAVVREHQAAHDPVRLSLWSRVMSGPRAAWLRVAIEVAAVRDGLARLRGRMVVRPMEEPLLAPARSWLELDQTSRYPWPTNTAAPVVEPEPETPTGRVPVQQMDLVSHARKWNADYQRLLEQKRVERESLQDTGLIPAIKEPVA